MALQPSLFTVKRKRIHDTVPLKGRRKFPHLWYITSPLEVKLYPSTPRWELPPPSRTPATALGYWDGYSKQVTSARQNNALEGTDSGWIVLRLGQVLPTSTCTQAMTAIPSHTTALRIFVLSRHSYRASDCVTSHVHCTVPSTSHSR